MSVVGRSRYPNGGFLKLIVDDLIKGKKVKIFRDDVNYFGIFIIFTYYCN